MHYANAKLTVGVIIQQTPRWTSDAHAIISVGLEGEGLVFFKEGSSGQDGGTAVSSVTWSVGQSGAGGVTQ